MINVTQIAEGSFEISWDPNDPIEQQLNNWTQEQFVEAIRKKIDDLKEEDLWIFMASDYLATGEGRTICLMMTQAVPSKDEDFDSSGNIITTQKYRAERKFEERFGYFSAFVEIIDRKEFFDKYKKLLPEALHDIKSDPCYIEYFSEFHYNYS